jgi:hypothetical protein
MKLKQIVVNPLGEVMEILGRRSYNHGPSSVNLGELKNRLGRAPTRLDCTNEFERQLREWCKGDPAVIHHVKTVWKLQKQNDGRFRHLGAAGRHHPLHRASPSGARPRPVEGGPARCERAWRHVGSARERPELDKFKKGNGPWQYGPMHGVKMRQADIQVKITDTRPVAVAGLKRRVAKATQALWSKSGVSVI